MASQCCSQLYENSQQEAKQPGFAAETLTLTLLLSWQVLDTTGQKNFLSADYLNEPFRAQRAMSVVSIMTSVIEGECYSWRRLSSML